MSLLKIYAVVAGGSVDLYLLMSCFRDRSRWSITWFDLLLL